MRGGRETCLKWAAKFAPHPDLVASRSAGEAHDIECPRLTPSRKSSRGTYVNV